MTGRTVTTKGAGSSVGTSVVASVTSMSTLSVVSMSTLSVASVSTLSVASMSTLSDGITTAGFPVGADTFSCGLE